MTSDRVIEHFELVLKKEGHPPHIFAEGAYDNPTNNLYESTLSASLRMIANHLDSEKGEEP